MAFPRRIWPDRTALVVDLAIVVANAAFMVTMIKVAEDPGAAPRDALAYTLGVLMVLPMAVRRRWPLGVLLACSVFLFAYYSLDYPGISPSGVLAVPLYTAVLTGRLRWAIGITTLFFGVGYFMVVVKEHNPVLETFVDFLPQAALVAVVILLAEVVVSRRELAAETRERLRQAEQERGRESARRVAEERLRIARELHDTVAHSMATIAVQAGSALHGLGDRQDQVHGTLSAIRETSKDALREMRATLGMLRNGTEDPPESAHGRPPGLDRLPALVDAVRSAGIEVDLQISGQPRAFEPPVDHAAYRIVQESLTNVLRHAGAQVRATVRVGYEEDGLALEIADDGQGVNGDAPGGHGLGGMRERAEAIGGTFRAGPGREAGFVVAARLPAAAP